MSGVTQLVSTRTESKWVLFSVPAASTHVTGRSGLAQEVWRGSERLILEAFKKVAIPLESRGWPGDFCARCCQLRALPLEARCLSHRRPLLRDSDLLGPVDLGYCASQQQGFEEEVLGPLPLTRMCCLSLWLITQYPELRGAGRGCSEDSGVG